MDGLKRDKSRTKSEKDAEIAKLQETLGKAKAVEAQNKDKISKLIADAEKYLNAHFDKEYYQPVKESCEQEKVLAKRKNTKRMLPDWKKNISRTFPSFLITRKSKMKNTFIRTGCLMLKWNCRKIFSRSKTEDMMHICISII